MNKSIKELFENSYKSPETKLSTDIWAYIITKESRASKIKLYSYISLSILSLSSFVMAVKNLGVQFSKSGFYEYISLAFSDGGTVLSHWREFALSLADSLPFTSLIFSLSLIFVLFISIRKITQQFKFDSRFSSI